MRCRSTWRELVVSLSVSAVLLLGVRPVTTEAQTTDPCECLYFSMEEEITVDPMVDYTMATSTTSTEDLASVDTAMMDSTIVIAMVDDPMPYDPEMAASTLPGPVPPDDWDLNDQGVFDKKRDYFSVYMGEIGGYDSWTHHGKYRKQALAWYAVLTTKPTIKSWLSRHALGGFEIRYWYDPIPGPLTYSARALIRTQDGIPFAEVFAMTTAARDYRLAELAILFGRPIMLSPAKLTEATPAAEK